MKTLLNLALCLYSVAAIAYSQTLTISTPLAAAMGRGGDTIQLTSSAGVFQAVTNPVTGLYIDREYMTVRANVGTNQWTVARGVRGLQSPHVQGATVWVGPPSAFDLGPNDRVGPCTATSFPNLPLVMIISGNVTYCAGGQYGNFANNPQVGAVVASIAGVMGSTAASQIIAKVTHVSGTNAITGFVIPPGLPDGGTFTIIPDGAFTYTNAGNITSTGTAVVGKALTFTYDRALGKLYPSY